VEAIVREVRQAVPTSVPVSAKLRLGWDDPRAIHENAARAARGGASWITIHGRTKQQGYTPPAYWGPIGAVRRSLDIPVVANGEIWSLEDFHRCREETGCEHFMLGRGALANPKLAPQVAHALGLGAGCAPYPEPAEWRSLIKRFLEITATNPVYSLKRLKQWMRYVALRRPFDGFHELKRLEAPELLPELLARIEFPVAP
jgi:tRNA-dihydrouridine synthase C